MADTPNNNQWPSSSVAWIQYSTINTTSIIFFITYFHLRLDQAWLYYMKSLYNFIRVHCLHVCMYVGCRSDVMYSIQLLLLVLHRLSLSQYQPITAMATTSHMYMYVSRMIVRRAAPSRRAAGSAGGEREREPHLMAWWSSSDAAADGKAADGEGTAVWLLSGPGHIDVSGAAHVPERCHTHRYLIRCHWCYSSIGWFKATRCRYRHFTLPGEVLCSRQPRNECPTLSASVTFFSPSHRQPTYLVYVFVLPTKQVDVFLQDPTGVEDSPRTASRRNYRCFLSCSSTTGLSHQSWGVPSACPSMSSW